ncbi:MAG TPA: MerR family transcriptional regulator [Thermoanaerobaculia bacterium]|nr:MerR family transcriptional regulator [Thermoanaerobaculia bacterium]
MAKVRVQKRLYYKIGEACKELGIQPYVLRYWETEFPALAPNKSRSGQRVYSEKELEIIRRIKQLLYEEGYTIAGAKKKLEAELESGLGGVEEAEGGEAEAQALEEPSPVAPVKTAKARREPAPPPEPTPQPSLPAVPEAREAGGAELDTDAAQRLQRLRSGIEKALQETREILVLLGPPSS